MATSSIPPPTALAMATGNRRAVVVADAPACWGDDDDGAGIAAAAAALPRGDFWARLLFEIVAGAEAEAPLQRRHSSRGRCLELGPVETVVENAALRIRFATSSAPPGADSGGSRNIAVVVTRLDFHAALPDVARNQVLWDLAAAAASFPLWRQDAALYIARGAAATAEARDAVATAREHGLLMDAALS
jgi:hypothetical protein